MSTSPGQYNVTLANGEDLLVDLRFEGGEYHARVGGVLHRLTVRPGPNGQSEILIDDEVFQLLGDDGSPCLIGQDIETHLDTMVASDAGAQHLGRVKAAVETQSEERVVNSPLTGLVIDVCVQDGQWVERGQTLLVIEAMKMENRIAAPFEGKVVAIKSTLGKTVRTRDPLLTLIPVGSDGQ